MWPMICKRDFLLKLLGFCLNYFKTYEPIFETKASIFIILKSINSFENAKTSKFCYRESHTVC